METFLCSFFKVHYCLGLMATKSISFSHRQIISPLKMSCFQRPVMVGVKSFTAWFGKLWLLLLLSIFSLGTSYKTKSDLYWFRVWRLYSSSRGVHRVHVLDSDISEWHAVLEASCWLSMLFIIIYWPHVFFVTHKRQQHKQKQHNLRSPCLPSWKQGLGLR